MVRMFGYPEVIGVNIQLKLDTVLRYVNSKLGYYQMFKFIISNLLLLKKLFINCTVWK